MLNWLKSSSLYDFSGVSNNTNLISPSDSNILTENLTTVKKNCRRGITFLKKSLNQKFERAVSGIRAGKSRVLEES